MYVSLETKKKFLGMRFHLDCQKGMVHIEQSALIMKMLMHFNMQDCDTSVLSPFLNPMPTKADIPEGKEEQKNMQKFTDTSYVENPDTHKSNTTVAGKRGGNTISWKRLYQTTQIQR